MSNISDYIASKHDSLLGVEEAGAGVTNGHITDAAQTITGMKTFTEVPKSSGIASTDTDLMEYKQFTDHLLLATSGVTNGHIDDQAQTIIGEKTFSEPPLSLADATEATQLLRFSQFDGHTHSSDELAAHYHDPEDVHFANDERILGRIDDSVEDGVELTPAQVRTMINVEDGANNYTHPSHTGDVTGSSTLTIGDDKVTYAKIQNVSGDQRILGRISGADGNIEELTAAQIRTMINVADDATHYIHPTYAGDDFSINSGAMTSGVVLSDIDINLTTDTNGHVTDANATIATRNLTASDIGAQPAGTYNTIIGTDSDINTSGATIIDNIYVTDGVITSMGTRTLSAADIGALSTTGTAANSSKLEGFVSNESSNESTIVRRDQYGDIKVRLLRTEFDTLNSACEFFLTQTEIGSGMNNYARPSSISQVKSKLGITDSTISTSSPSGGSAGDVWYKV